MHLARATASPAPKPRAALRKRAFARTYSPSCAIAMPRSARAGASSRRATRFNAPRGSPAASARAAAVIRESIGIPSHWSLPPFGYPAPGAPHVSVYELGVRGAVPFVRAREGRTRRVVEISGRRGLEVEVAEGVDAAHQHGRRLVRHALVLHVG